MVCGCVRSRTCVLFKSWHWEKNKFERLHCIPSGTIESCTKETIASMHVCGCFHCNRIGKWHSIVFALEGEWFCNCNCKTYCYNHFFAVQIFLRFPLCRIQSISITHGVYLGFLYYGYWEGKVSLVAYFAYGIFGNGMSVK